MSTAVSAGVAAGVRSALIVNLGWTETVITSVYEYREVKSVRSVRGGRMLLDELYKALRKLTHPEAEEGDAERLISFGDCEDIMCRLMWCRPSSFKSLQRQSAQLETVEEQDESEVDTLHASQSKGSAKIPLRTAGQQRMVEIPFDTLANICEDTYFDTAASPSSFDDHELPAHLLLYQHLLQLPVDVRAVCMSRIIFTGGCSNILGIKERIMDEMSSIVDRRGWEPVSGKGVEQLKSNARLQGKGRIPKITEPQDAAGGDNGDDVAQQDLSGSNKEPQQDPIDAKLARQRKARPQVKGQLRAIHSLGPWTGGSLLCQLKIPALATIDRELWLQHGASGATRASDVDVKAQQRQSMGAGGLIRGSGGHHTNWTLGAWGLV